MNARSALAGGLAGAATLTLLHEGIRRVVPEAPRMDRLGMQAISKGLRKAGREVPDEKSLFTVTMVGDLLSNALYYSAAGIGKEKSLWWRGAALGLAAGLGGVFLPKPMGLNQRHSNRTVATQVMTVGLYLTGALVTAAVIKALSKKKAQEKEEWEHRLVTSAMG